MFLLMLVVDARCRSGPGTVFLPVLEVGRQGLFGKPGFCAKHLRSSFRHVNASRLSRTVDGNPETGAAANNNNNNSNNNNNNHNNNSNNSNNSNNNSTTATTATATTATVTTTAITTMTESTIATTSKQQTHHRFAD